MTAELLGHAQGHLAILHPWASTVPAAAWVIEIACTSDGRVWRSEWFTIASVAAEYAVDQGAAGFAVFAGINPRHCMRSRGAGRNEDVAAVTALVLDFDRRHEHDPERAIHFLAGAGIPASVVVESGGGRHVYLLLAEALRPADGNALAKRLHIACGGDPVHDLRRIVRVPGTPNLKRGAWCYIVEQHPERRYAAAQVTLALDTARIPTVSSEPPARPAEAVNAPAEMAILFDRLHPETLQAIMACSGPVIDAVAMRTDGGGRSWSEVDFRIVRRLVVETDATDEQIVAVFASYPIGQHSRRKPRRYLSHTIASVRRRLGEHRFRGSIVAPPPADSPQPAIVVEDRRPPDLIRMPDGRTAINPRARSPRLAPAVPMERQ